MASVFVESSFGKSQNRLHLFGTASPFFKDVECSLEATDAYSMYLSGRLVLFDSAHRIYPVSVMKLLSCLIIDE